MIIDQKTHHFPVKKAETIHVAERYKGRCDKRRNLKREQNVLETCLRKKENHMENGTVINIIEYLNASNPVSRNVQNAKIFHILHVARDID